MWWDGHAGMGWWMVFGGVVWVAFIGILAALLVQAVRGSQRGGEERRDEETPDAIARRRYARGEISAEELREIEKTLREVRP